MLLEVVQINPSDCLFRTREQRDQDCKFVLLMRHRLASGDHEKIQLSKYQTIGRKLDHHDHLLR